MIRPSTAMAGNSAREKNRTPRQATPGVAGRAVQVSAANWDRALALQRLLRRR